MGLVRTAASVSTLGAVKYTSKREALTKQALAEAKLAGAKRERVLAEMQAQAETRQAGGSTGSKPWYLKSTRELLTDAAQRRHEQGEK